MDRSVRQRAATAGQLTAQAEGLLESLRTLENRTFLIDLVDEEAAYIIHFQVLQVRLDGPPDTVELPFAP